MTRLALLLALLPAAAAAQSLEGRFALDPAACEAADETRPIVVTPGAIDFHESRCTLADPEPVAGLGGATLFAMTCTGEGETWTRRVLLAPLLDGGLARVEEGFAATYVRCP